MTSRSGGGRRAAVFVLAACLLGASLLPSAAAAAAAAATTEAQAALLQELDQAASESEAKALLEPHIEQLKSLKPEVVEKVIMRQWWELARELVAKSHTQGVDLSFAVRKAVRVLKEEADELLRTLNPKYGQAQQVAPSFQWAQNDTCILLTVKYTVRWNAPGALEVTEPSVNMSGNIFNFTGLGKHSNNKYLYFLSLNLFDNINPEVSTWNAASVGKLSVTLRKKWARKWPRLIANKKQKISNMHMWSERQEVLDSTLGGMSTVSNSPVTCRMNEKLYCLATDTCKKPDMCSQCPGKSIAVMEESTCTGMPSEKASLSFKDADMDENTIGGQIKITKARNDFDIDSYEIFWGKDDKSKLEHLEGVAPKIGSAEAAGVDTEVTIPMHTPIPEGCTHILSFSTNVHGEFATPGSVLLTDAVLPKGKPTSLAFVDEDGDKNEISGTVTIGKADNMDRVDEYALHWGKSEKKKINSGSSIRDVRILKDQRDKDVTHSLGLNTKIPDGATHILAFTKNSHGENPHSVNVKIVDGEKPCLKEGQKTCPRGITAEADQNPEAGSAKVKVSITRAENEESLLNYSVYFGRKGCVAGESGQAGAKNGHIKNHAVSEPSDFEIEQTVPAASTHLLVFAQNKLGESDHCVSTPFQDAKPPSEGDQKAEL